MSLEKEPRQDMTMKIAKRRFQIPASVIQNVIRQPKKSYSPEVEAATRRIMAQADTSPQGLKEALDRTFKRLREMD